MDHCIYNDIIFMQEISQFIESSCKNVQYNGMVQFSIVAPQKNDINMLYNI